MQVKLLTGRVGDRFSQRPGTVIEVSSDEGRRLIERGQAVEVATNPLRGVESRSRKQESR